MRYGSVRNIVRSDDVGVGRTRETASERLDSGGCGEGRQSRNRSRGARLVAEPGSSVAAFNEVSDALVGALDIQLATRVPSPPGDGVAVTLSVAIHVGGPRQDPVKQRAQQLCALAAPGQSLTCLSTPPSMTSAPSGCGISIAKSGCTSFTTALHAADQASERFADRVWFVDLAAVTDTDLVTQAIADAIGALESGTIRGVDAVVHHPDEFARLEDGDQELMGFFVGQAMKATQGKADGKAISALLRERAAI